MRRIFSSDLRERAVIAVEQEGLSRRAAAWRYPGACTAIVSVRRSLGWPIPMADCRIAAIARVHGPVLATRKLCDVEDFGLSLVDPWQGG